MAAIGISALASFFADEPKSLQRGENHFKSDHVESFSYYPGEISGVVSASMKSKSYKVVVSLFHSCPRLQIRTVGSACRLVPAAYVVRNNDCEQGTRLLC